MLIAERKFSLGETALAAGDVITAEMVEGLPPGRLETLKTTHFISERTDTDNEELVARLRDQVDALAARVGKLEKATRRKKETS